MQPNNSTPVNLKGIIATFAQHRVAANLLMFLLLLLGLVGLKNINSQIFPNFEMDYISVNIVWSGASAEDIEESIVLPIEQELTTLTELKRLTSTSKQGIASFLLEVYEHEDTESVLDKVKQRISTIRNLPEQAENPTIVRIENFSPVANLLVSGDATTEELDHLAHRFEQELLDRGISKIYFYGMPAEQIAIEVDADTLVQTGLSLGKITELVSTNSQNIPAGTAAKNTVSKQVRSQSQPRTVEEFANLPITSDSKGRMLRLGDIANIERRAEDDQPYISWEGKPAIELILMRTDADDTLETAAIFNEWLEETRPTLPDSVTLKVHNERYKNLQERITLLVNNGASGLILVILTLFLFLNVRVAFWVTVGIPVCFFATIAVMHFTGSTINMISLFALIMALGIIVDDAIVVGEDALSHKEMGEPPVQAAVGGAQRMWHPVLSSSLTTIAAFLPLALVDGIMGKIMFEIPTVIICMIIVSLVECFLILPGHLAKSMKAKSADNETGFQARFDRAFTRFRDNKLRPLVTLTVKYSGAVITLGLCAFVFSLALVASGHLKFNFFPVIDGNSLRANVEFQPGTSPQTVKDFLTEVERALHETAAEYDEELIDTVISYHNRSFFVDNAGPEIGSERGAVITELRSGDRPLTNTEFMAAWRDNIQFPPGINKFKMKQPDFGPGGPPIGYQLIGNDITKLKAASLELQKELLKFNGVSNIDDDLPFGKEQLIYELTPAGRRLGLSTRAIGQQLRAAFDGNIAQIFYDGDREIEVKVSLPRSERDKLQTLEYFPIVLPDGSTTPLSNVVAFKSRQGLEKLNHTDGLLTTTVTADIDSKVTNSNEIRSALEQEVFPELRRQYGVRFGLEGQALEQQETMEDMRTGMMVGFSLIYIILAWVFSSYSWPLAVMSAIPLGLTGAIFGHILVGQNLSIMSMMGLFGLSGIVINDSIVLITFYAQLRRQGQPLEQAIVNAVCARFRAVLLTSLTTIAGLLPILFETSLQAQFLIPMAVSIVFGLAYATFLILFFVPSMLISIERLRGKLGLGSQFTAPKLTQP